MHKLRKFFGTTNNTGYDSIHGEFFIIYKLGKYLLYFVSEPDKYEEVQKLNDNVKFHQISVRLDYSAR
ncbi:hypothetical protein PB1_12904 [Bacillus methanolicus PB1]|uniref:Uncharacterized protein n=1 Tax=Bacillus methanolicus PB1 TaxID=997296 RepID=I3DW36_BACMT|nr:hypothetical protein PB1_12904 [Bacillus methanolicus PB1]